MDLTSREMHLHAVVTQWVTIVAQCHERIRGAFATSSVMDARRYPLDATEHESRFGFAVAEVPSGARALAVRLRDGLHAVKVLTDDGAIEYLICDERLEPMYISAKSLEELQLRFGL
jgi:hypothetical protein